jgi:hypothetical protein
MPAQVPGAPAPALAEGQALAAGAPVAAGDHIHCSCSWQRSVEVECKLCSFCTALSLKEHLATASSYDGYLLGMCLHPYPRNLGQAEAVSADVCKRSERNTCLLGNADISIVSL